MLNPFSNDAFNMVALTAAINRIPNNYGRLEQLNLMPAEGVRTRTILIEEMSGVLNLLPTRCPSAPRVQCHCRIHRHRVLHLRPERYIRVKQELREAEGSRGSGSPSSAAGRCHAAADAPAAAGRAHREVRGPGSAVAEGGPHLPGHQTREAEPLAEFGEPEIRLARRYQVCAHLPDFRDCRIRSAELPLSSSHVGSPPAASTIFHNRSLPRDAAWWTAVQPPGPGRFGFAP